MSKMTNIPAATGADTENKSMLSIRNLSKHFGSVHALDHVDLDIREGEFFGLLGPSGCGKTTLLRILGGFETPSAGEIMIDGQDVSHIAPNRRPVNTVFQSYAISPHLTVAQNVAYGLRKSGLSKEEIAAKVEVALQMVQLDGYGSRGADQLSGGQRQRVALVRALVKEPKVLLLDEPLGALDKQLRESMQLELRALQKRLGITFVFVTHDQEEALSMSDRIAVMAEGRVLQVDTPRGLYEVPASRRVAEFIGTMNIFEARVSGHERTQVALDAGPLGRVLIEPANAARPEIGASVSLGVRPEKLSITDAPRGAGFNSVEGRLSASAYFGDRNHFFVELDGLPRPVSVATQSDALAGTLPGVQPNGEAVRVWLNWPVAGPVLLPAE